jgi:hypothetical protein
LADDDFEILTPTEVEATIEPTPVEVDKTSRIRKLCACGCGEEVTGNRALKRGHTMGEGLPQSIFGGNDILVFQAAGVALLGGISAGLENKFSIPKMEAEESQAIGEPLGRIAARHIPKQILRHMKPGDAADSVAIISIMAAYIIRITTMPKEKREVPVATNGHIVDSSVSGLGQYSYRPPEQNFQQQTGSPN